MFSKEFKVGLLALVAGVILYVGFNYLKGIELLSSTNVYYAVYDKVDGLQVSNPVIINGLPVGRVSEINILQDRGNQLLVGIEVKENIRVSKDSKAILADGDLLGGKVIDLKVGSLPELLEDEDTIISEKDAGLTGLLKEKALPVLSSFDSTIITLNALAKEYQGMSVKIKSIMDNVEGATDTLNLIMNENRATIRGILANIERLSRSLEKTEKEIQPLLANLNAITDSVKAAPINTLITDARNTLSELQKSAASLNNGEGTLGMLMTDDSLYQNMNQTMADLDSLFIDLRENPKRYVHFSLFGRKKD